MSLTNRPANRLSGPSQPLGTVAFEDTLLLLWDEPISFGRAKVNDVPIGRAPIYDEIVPRRAGFVVGMEGRILVANTDDRLAFDIVLEDRQPVPVRPGWAVSPPGREFDIVVVGALRYEIAVAANIDGTAVHIVTSEDRFSDELPTGARLELTPRQREVLNAYVDPVRLGGSPASHQQVADKLNLSRSTARQECNKIWSKMLLAGVPLRDLDDARDQVVDAWTRHRL